MPDKETPGSAGQGHHLLKKARKQSSDVYDAADTIGKSLWYQENEDFQAMAKEISKVNTAEGAARVLSNYLEERLLNTKDAALWLVIQDAERLA